MPKIRKDEPCDADCTLLTATRTLLRDRSLYEVYQETGVPYFWLRSLMRGDSSGPSVNRIQYLYEKLTGKKIDLRG